MEVYEKIQARLNAKPMAPTRIDIALDFPLRNFVNCADCGSPLTGYWAANRTGKKYAYYECRGKGCQSRYKTIPRDKIELEFVERLSRLQPSMNIVSATRTILEDMWRAKEVRAAEHRRELTAVMRKTDVEIEKLLDLIVGASSSTMVSAYEKRILEFQQKRALCGEKIADLGRGQASFDEMFEHTINIFSSPCDIWKNRDYRWKRMVLKVVFAERLPYCRKTGFRTAKTTFPFKVLAGPGATYEIVVPGDGFEPPTRGFSIRCSTN